MSIEFNDIFNNLNRRVIIRYFDTLICGIFESLDVYQTLYDKYHSNPDFVMFEIQDIIYNKSFNKVQKRILLSKNMMSGGYFEIIGYEDEISERDMKRIKMEHKLRREK